MLDDMTVPSVALAGMPRRRRRELERAQMYPHPILYSLGSPVLAGTC